MNNENGEEWKNIYPSHKKCEIEAGGLKIVPLPSLTKTI